MAMNRFALIPLRAVLLALGLMLAGGGVSVSVYANTASHDVHPACEVDDWSALDQQQIQDWAQELDSDGRLSTPICQPFGETLLHLVVRSAPMTSIEWLLAWGARTDVVTIDLCSPLCRALFWGRADVGIRLFTEQQGRHDDALEIAVQRVLLHGDAAKLRPFFDILLAQDYRFLPYHFALALRNADAGMTAILLEAGLSPDTFVPSGLGGPPTRLSAMEFAVLNSPDTRVFKLLWDHGVTPNLSGQIREEGFWSLGDLVYERAQTTEKFHDVMAMFSVHARPGAMYSDCISDYSDRISKDGSQSFCLMAYGLSVRHKKEDFWTEFARRYVGRVPQPFEDEDENLRYPLAAEEAMNREGVIYDSQSRS